MLRALHVQNLALIESLELEFEPGFTCLTGETGAGKSILLDALGLLLGVRASAEMVRSGADRALIEGLFEPAPGSDAFSWMEQAGIPSPEGQLVVTREVSAQGKTIARVNGRIVTVQALRELGQHLVQQHGQHDSVGLLRREEHLRVLDAFGAKEVAAALEEYRKAFVETGRLRREVSDLERRGREREQRMDLLRFQVGEIESARLKPGEEEELRERRGRLRHAERLRGAVDEVYGRVYEGSPRQPAVIDEIGRLLGLLEPAREHDAKLDELREYLDTALVNLTEAAEFVRRYRSGLESDPEALSALEDRLAGIERLLKKYGETSSAVLRHARDATEELERLSRYDDALAELRARLLKSELALSQSAVRLTAARKAAAKGLENVLTSELDALWMKNARISVLLSHAEPSLAGEDEAEFVFSANRGEDLRPLAKIASGGELSRVMLAIVKSLAGCAGVPTLVFDEIDSGISGRAAQAVAERMKEIASVHQVLCVTHLPQMASMARRHILIEKRTKDGRTVTEARLLSAVERVEELAKMLGGKHVTDATRGHARELLAHSGQLPV